MILLRIVMTQEDCRIFQNLLKNSRIWFIITMLHKFHNQRIVRCTPYLYIGVFCPVVFTKFVFDKNANSAW